MSEKRQMQELLDSMPDTVTKEEFIRELIEDSAAATLGSPEEQTAKLERAWVQLDNGEGVPHDEAMRRLARWFE